MDTIELKAYAKVNIGLDVQRRRPDGYHDVCMVMQTVSLHDTIIISKTKKNGITVSTNNRELPTDKGNLVYQAAELLQKEMNIKGGISINLEKRIPVAAGMAGGSTDAAAVLKGMNQLYSLHLSEEELMKRGVSIGADVPYCIAGGTMLAEGIGEKLSRLVDFPKCRVLIAKPDISVSTKWVYENLCLDRTNSHPDMPGLCRAMKTGSLSEIGRKMENILEQVTEKKYPVIREIKQKMDELGAVRSMMSGSGPTVFGLFEQEETLHAAYEKLQEMKEIKELYEADIVSANV